VQHKLLYRLQERRLTRGHNIFVSDAPSLSMLNHRF